MRPSPHIRMHKQHRPLRLGLDVDGVICDWTTGAAKTLAEVNQRNLIPDPFVPNVWDWIHALGYRKSEIDAFYKHINTHPTWWLDLAPYSGTATFLGGIQRLIELERLSVTFITTRADVRTGHAQTTEWLYRLGIRYPQVCIAGNEEHKGHLARGLRLDAYVDDNAANLIAVKALSPSTALGFYVQPWQERKLDAAIGVGAHPVRGARELFGLVERWTPNGKDGKR